MNTASDTRLAYGARCTWFGPIQEVGSVGPSRLPCCPLCGSMLFELPTEAAWWEGVDRFEAEGHPGYRALWEWQREQKKCFSNTRGLTELIDAYRAATGKEVKLP